jgi:NuA3 HAT complex component NTO1
MKKARGGSAIKKANSALTTLPSPVITTKTARAHAKSYRPGPPIVPHIIVQSVIDYVAKINIRKRQGLVERVCRYWSLKREARRGAPLLKRLHLEVRLIPLPCDLRTVWRYAGRGICYTVQSAK